MCSAYLFQIVVRFDDNEHRAEIERAGNRAENAAMSGWEYFAQQQKWNASETNRESNHVDD